MKEPTPNIESPLHKLIDVKAVAEMCGVSQETIRRLNDRGAMPKPIRLGRAVRWNVLEIQNWISQGCPTKF